MFTFVNVFGLALGIACSILIALWVQDELRYDRFHTDGDRIYQVMANMQQGDKITTWTNTPQPLQPLLDTQFPEVEATAIVKNPSLHALFEHALFEVDEQHLQEAGYFASPSLFTLFFFPFVQGNATTALEDINSIVISEAMAQRHYGPDWAQQNLVGKMLVIVGQGSEEETLKIGGVFQDIPSHSTLRFDFIRPIARHIQDQDEISWRDHHYINFVKLHVGTDPVAFEHKIKDVIMENDSGIVLGVTLLLHPYEKLYLYSNFENGKNTGGRITFIRIFSVVAILILLIACINFMNLSTAQSSQRAKEIGVRKAIGAIRRSLILQFISEAVMLAFLAMLLALLIVYLLLPIFNDLTGKTVAIDFTQPVYWLLGLGVVLLTGLMAGSYPALFLSSFNTVRTLKGNLSSNFGAANLRKALVVFQFALSALMIIGTLIVHQQMQYIYNKELGLNRDNLIYIPLGNAQPHYEVVRNQLLQHPSIESVTSTNQNPMSVVNAIAGLRWDGNREGDGAMFYLINTNLDYIETMQIELKEGRDFSAEFATDTANFIVNEAATRAMGIENPIGEVRGLLGQKGQIIGVVKDFHLQSMHVPIAPLILRYDPSHTWMLFVRAKARETQQAVAALEEIHTQYNPEYPFEYHFMDEEFAQLYQSEIVMGQLITYFAVLAIVIACLGLFGLASYAAVQRTKEIGIRKVLGASVSSILLLLSRDYVKLIIIALLIVIPIANYFMAEWLQNFAYHIEIKWWLFAIPGVIVLLIALLSVSGQTMKAAKQNPVESLRYE